MKKKFVKIYYCGGLISLMGLPILFFTYYQYQIDNLLRKSTIEFDLPAIDGSFVETLKYSPKYRAKYIEYSYVFQSGSEADQIEAFRLFHKNIEIKSNNDKYYFVVVVDSKCSYNLFIQVLDVLDQTKYQYETRGNLLYAKRMSKESTAIIINYKTIRHSNDMEWFKKLFLRLNQNQQLGITFIGVFWLILLFAIIRSRSNMLSAT